MDLTRLAIISKKEFTDHILSKRLFWIMIIFCIVLVIETASGVDDYNNALESYKSGGASGEFLIFQPSALRVFSDIVSSIGVDGLGIVIGLALGFDLISGERERGSIKTILSQPLYRDELINGKAIGGIMALNAISIAGFIIIFAVMLILGIVPDIDEILGIGLIWLITLLFMIASFTVSLMTSVITNTSSGSLILALVIVFIMLFIIPTGGGELGTYLLVGNPPEDIPDMASSAQYAAYQEAMDEYNGNSMGIRDFFNTFSIRYVYQQITLPITMPSGYAINKDGLDFDSIKELAQDIEEPTFWTLIEDQWVKLIVFIMWPVIFFGTAYVRFMKSDLR
ncbi:ABC-type transport system involved in multi-copper enzyme maturation permease component-like protein [Methanolacinia petrolearia DSM 11571]|uniref:ABC-type transport system involved in multi-copper enzyme maturation permease component-like protein n=1 Tax=Methanolacinia petrolearia (strain DSM 11571 / OCM 486 / SEBR 4847) TaxID=679926 RepID=E1RGQ6_METP4|nr:ABC transporter permease subunit [Methanolacinia petrolearia]ADN36351.1 ABC-type transport system involved in multi-copper enzyme maturation permease component-like protein [Methanolacinia petrolearia DSM 11571]